MRCCTIGSVVGIAVSLILTEGSSAQNCGLERGASYTAQENTHANVIGSLGSVAQEFVLASPIVIDRVKVHLHTGPGPVHAITLVLATDPLGMNPLATSVTDLPANGHAFFAFNFKPVGLDSGVNYYILLAGNPQSGDTWCAMNGTISGPADPFPEGRAFHNGSPVNGTDYAFVSNGEPDPGKPCDYQNGDGTYAATFQASGPIVPSSVIHFDALPGAQMLLCKDVRSATVQLQQATLDIQVGPAINGFSQYVVTGGQGTFNAYVFNGVPIPPSNFTVLNGRGSIEWASGDLIGDISVHVTAAGWTEIYAIGHSSGRTNLTTGRVTMVPDGLTVEIQSADIPTLQQWGLILVGLVTMASGVIVLYVRRRGGWYRSRTTPLKPA